MPLPQTQTLTGGFPTASMTSMDPPAYNSGKQCDEMFLKSSQNREGMYLAAKNSSCLDMGLENGVYDFGMDNACMEASSSNTAGAMGSSDTNDVTLNRNLCEPTENRQSPVHGSSNQKTKPRAQELSQIGILPTLIQKLSSIFSRGSRAAPISNDETGKTRKLKDSRCNSMVALPTDYYCKQLNRMQSTSDEENATSTTRINRFLNEMFIKRLEDIDTNANGNIDVSSPTAVCLR